MSSTSSLVEQPNWGSLTKTTYGYDALDRPTSVQSPSSGTTATYYGGWTTEAVDANNHCRTWDRDALGRVVTATLFDGTDGSFKWWLRRTSHGTTYGYDAASRLTGVTDPAGTTTRISTTWRAARSGWRIRHGTRAYGYDSNGNLTTQIDPRGQVILSSYDALDRPTGHLDPPLPPT